MGLFKTDRWQISVPVRLLQSFCMILWAVPECVLKEEVHSI